MSTTPTDTFIDGQGIPVELAEVGTALDLLWGPAAEKAGGPELDHPAVTRVALANVVVVSLGADRPDINETIAAITSSYPSRLIVVCASGDGNRHISAEVSARCHLPAPGRPQVCSELIILRTGSEGLALIPGAVRSLLESDLHSVLWWCGDPREAPELFDQLAEGSTRVILDLPDPSRDHGALASAASTDQGLLVRDIAWFGLTPWRELVADLFDPPEVVELRRLTSIRVRVRSGRASQDSRAAAWLVSWIAGQLGWQPVGMPGSEGLGRLVATLHSAGGPVSVRIDSEEAEVGPFSQIAEVELTLGSDPEPTRIIRIHRAGSGDFEVRVEQVDRSASPLPRLILASGHDATRRVSAALLTDRNDPPYRRALPIALWLLGLGS